MLVPKRTALIVATTLVTLVTACGGAASPKPSATVASSATAGGSIAVEMKEWAVTPASTTAKAGAVSFKVTNGGTLVHEFVVVKTDTKATDLTVVDGKIDESALTPVGEVEDIAAGANGTLEVTLAAGHYVLLCNVETHYGQGMRADFDVN